jgi:hypothetical protein
MIVRLGTRHYNACYILRGHVARYTVTNPADSGEITGTCCLPNIATSLPDYTVLHPIYTFLFIQHKGGFSIHLQILQLQLRHPRLTVLTKFGIA